MSLSILEWKQLYHNPFQYLLTSNAQILSLFKRKVSSTSTELESFYHSTTPNGYCSVQSLHQLYQRYFNDYDISLSQFIQHLTNISHKDNPDNNNISHIQRFHQQQIKCLDSQYWLGADNYDKYDFQFKFSLWTLTTQDPNYLSLAFTNQLLESHKILTSHRLNITQICTLAAQANECNYSNQHFYIVPEEFQLCLNNIDQQIQQALHNMLPSIQLLLHDLIPHNSQRDNVNPDINGLNTLHSSQTKITSFFSSSQPLEPVSNLVSVTNGDDEDDIHNVLHSQRNIMDSDSEVLMDFLVDNSDEVSSSSNMTNIHHPYDIPRLCNIIATDKFFIQPESKRFLSAQLEIGIIEQPEFYPSLKLREHLHYLLSRTVVKPSRIPNSGNGLFANTKMHAGELIQIYGGSPQPVNPYSMSVRANPLHVVGGPPTNDKWTKAGAINDYIWSSDMINCKRDSNGSIYTTRIINPGEELYMSYGMEYDWDHVKQEYHLSLLDSIVKMVPLLPSTIKVPDISVIKSTYSHLLTSQHQGFLSLLQDFLAYDKGPASSLTVINNHDDEISFPLHDNSPSFSTDMTTYQWIEVFMRSKWFYKHQCFRNHANPNQTISPPQLSVTYSHNSSRSSSRLANKPRVSYIHMYDTDNNSSFVMQYPPSPVELLYQHEKLSIDSTMSPLSHASAMTTNDTDTFPVSSANNNEVLQANDSPILSNMDDNQNNFNISSDHSGRFELCNSKTEQSSDIDSPIPAHSMLEQLADNICPIRFKKKVSSSGIISLFINIGSNSELKRAEIYKLMIVHKADAVFITDCKVTSTNMTSYRYHAKYRVPTGTVILLFPTQHSHSSNALIGGTMILLSKRLTYRSSSQLVALGTLIQLKVEFENLPIQLISLYFPRHNNEQGSLQSRLSQLMSLAMDDVHQHIHTKIKDIIYQAMTTKMNTILMGDLNVNIVHNKFSEFSYLMNELNMKHAATDIELQQFSYRMPTTTTTHSSSRIDFVLYSGDSIKPISSQCLYHEYYHNDHVPILSTFHVIGHQQQHQHPMHRPGTVSYDWSDICARAQYERIAANMSSHEHATSHERLELITKDAVSIAVTLKPVKCATRSLIRDDMCPANQVIRLAKKFLILINRHVFGFRNYLKWTNTSFGIKLRNIRKQWFKDIASIQRISKSHNDLLTITEYGPLYWRHKTLDEIRNQIHHAIKELNHLSTRKIKQQRNQEYRLFAAKRQYLYQIQQIGIPIQSILKTNKITYDMSCIRDADGIWTSQPGLITATLKDTFTKWFALDDTEDNSSDCWLYDQSSFLAHTDSENIPRNVASKIWVAMQSPASDKTSFQRFQQQVMQTPSFTEYMTEVSRGSARSAGGMSGLTYGMLRSIPPHVHTSIYQALSDIWESSSIPQTWKWRWLLPIPKIEDPLPSQLRPLCLLEVLRKLWSSIFVQKIANYIHKEKILHQGQHAGKSKGTDSAVLEFAAILETAKEHKTQLYLSSYDFKRAYDSIQRKYQTFAWIRSHIPERLASFLVTMDEDSYMVVKTPLAQEVFNQQGYQGLIEHDIALQPQQGTAQGGVDSSLVFAAFLDILVTAIANESPSFYLSDIDGNLEPSYPIAYVDDLIAAQGTHKDMQSVAEIVSAFSIIFNINLNTSKFRAFAVNWGNHHDSLENYMTIYSKGWTPTTVPLQHDGTIEHLGVMWDMSQHNVQMYENIVTQLDTSLKLILASKASAEIKLTTINVKLIPQLLYQAKFSPWSLQQYKKLDILFNSAYKQINSQRYNFPSALLYMDSNVLGHNLIRFSDQVQIAKLHLWQRSVYGQNARRHFIINSMTARSLRQSGSIPVRFGQYTFTNIESSIPKRNKNTWWFSSLVDHLHQHKVSLRRNKMTQAPTPSHFNATQTIQLQHLYYGIVNETESLLPSDTPHNNYEYQRPVPITDTYIRSGQIWLLHDWSTGGKLVYEIMGFWQNQVAFLMWNLHDDQVTVSLTHSNQMMRGAGSIHLTNLHNLFHSSTKSYFLLTLDPERYTPQGNISKITQRRARNPLLAEPVNQPFNHQWFDDNTADLLMHVVPNQKHQTLIEKIANPPSYTGSIYIRKIDNQHIPHLLQIQNTAVQHSTITSMHILGLHIAAKYTKNNKQIISVTNNIGIKYHRMSANKPMAHPMSCLLVPALAPRMFPLLALNQSQKSFLKTYVKHNKSGSRSKLSISSNLKDHSFEQRLFLSDAIDSNDHSFKQRHPLSTITTITDESLLSPLYHNMNGLLCHEESGLPFLNDYECHIRSIQSLNYLKQRDVYREQIYSRQNRTNTNPTYWLQSSSRLAGEIFAHIPKGSLRAFVTRMSWDWHLTGINSCKTLDTLETATCRLCDALVEDQRHIIWECSNKHMCECRLTHIKHIDNQLALQEKVKKSKIRSAIHQLLRDPSNYELILGRVHSHHNKSINNLQLLSKSNSANIYKQFVNTIKHYTVMVMSLYNTRQKLLNTAKEDTNSTQINLEHIQIDHNKIRAINGEALMGVAQYHHISNNGSKIVKQIDLSANNTSSGYMRHNITSANSIYLRKLHNQNQRSSIILDNREGRKLFTAITEYDELIVQAPDHISQGTHQVTDLLQNKTNIYNNTDSNQDSHTAYHITQATNDNTTTTSIKCIKNSCRSNNSIIKQAVSCDPNNTTHHYMWGSKWDSNSCAIDAATFALNVIHHQSNLTNRALIETQLPDDLLSTISLITQQNLSHEAWDLYTKDYRKYIYNSKLPKHIRFNSYTDIDNVTNLLFPKIDADTHQDHMAWTYSYEYKCDCQHTFNVYRYKKYIAIQPPNITQTLESALQMKINELHSSQVKCQLCANNTTRTTFKYLSPLIMFVKFVDLLFHPHKQLNIDKQINLMIHNQIIQYDLQSVTYYNGNHFIQRSKLNNGDIIHYDGMKHNGQAQIVTPSNNYNHFPSTIIINKTSWEAHTAWYIRTNNIHNPSYNSQQHESISSAVQTSLSTNIINLTDESVNSKNTLVHNLINMAIDLTEEPISTSSLNKKRARQINTNNNNNNNNSFRPSYPTKKKSSPKQIEQNVDIVYNNNITTANSNCSNSNQNSSSILIAKQCNRTSSSSKYNSSINKKRSLIECYKLDNLSVQNAYHINNVHTHINSTPIELTLHNSTEYPILSPPQIVIVEDSEQQDKKQIRNQEFIRILPQKRSINEVVPLAQSESNTRRPRGLCSPGTAEGRSGQG